MPSAHRHVGLGGGVRRARPPPPGSPTRARRPPSPAGTARGRCPVATSRGQRDRPQHLELLGADLGRRRSWSAPPSPPGRAAAAGGSAARRGRRRRRRRTPARVPMPTSSAMVICTESTYLRVPHRLEQRRWRSAGPGCSGPSPCPGSGRCGTRPARVNTSSTRSLSSLAEAQVVAERLLHHDPAPAAGLVVVGHAGAVELLEHDRERRRRDRQVERGVAGDAVACRAARRGSRRAWSNASSSSNEPRHELDVAGQPGPHLVAPRGAGVLLGRLAGQRLEVAVAPVAAGEAEHHEAGRQQPPVGQVVDGRDQLLAGQVAGHAEDHQRARLRDPRQPPVLRVAQRVHRRLLVRRDQRQPPAAVERASSSWATPAARSVRCRRSSGRSAAGERLPVAGGLGGLQLAEACTACPAPRRSSATAPVICRNAPTCGPPLWYCPVECRKRGPQPNVTGRARRGGQQRPQLRPRRRRRTGRGRPSPRGSPSSAEPVEQPAAAPPATVGAPRRRRTPRSRPR